MHTNYFSMLAILIVVALYLGASTAQTDEAVIRRIEATEDLVRRLVSQVEDLQTQDILQRKQIANLESKLRYQQQRNARFERLVKNLLIQTNTECSMERDSNLIIHPENTTEDHASHRAFRERERSNRIRRADNETPVAFFATMGKHLEHAGVNQIFVFDDVVTNVGNGYNNHLGSFIAPVSGVYVFTTTLLSFYHVSGHAHFVKNGIALTTLYVSGSEAGYDTTSQTIVLNLQRGDDVTIQNQDTDKSFIGAGHSTFAGFLLQEHVSSPSIVGK